MRDLLIPLLLPILVLNAIFIVVAARAVMRRADRGLEERRKPATDRRSALRRSSDAPDAAPAREAAPAPEAVAAPEEVVAPEAGLPPEAGPPSDLGPSDAGPSSSQEVVAGPAAPRVEHVRRRGTSRPEVPAIRAQDATRAMRSTQPPAGDEVALAALDRDPVGYGMTTATVAIVGLGGLEALADASGGEVADAMTAAMSDALRRLSRGSDRVTDLGGGRFRILLPSTEEPAAASFLGRVHAACDPWLDAAAAPLVLVTATAATGQDGDLTAARRHAERRFERALAGGRQTRGRSTSA